ARDVFEHRPRELCVSVNGRPVGAQRVGSVVNEQKLNVGAGEEVSFVEVFSEQDVRLLFLDVEGEKPSGARGAATPQQSLSASVSLSDARRLEAVLSFDGAWPTVRVVYDDPTLASVAERFAEADARHDEEATATAASHGRETASPSSSTTRAHDDANAGAASPARAKGVVAAWLARVLGALRPPKFWLRPATLTAAVALVVVAAILLTRVYVTPVSAAALLDRSAAAEERAGADTSLVLHRAFTVEEAEAGRASTRSRLRVEVWQSAARGLRLRRVYDQQQRLVAVERVEASGAVTVFRRDAAPEQWAASATASALLEAGEAWRLDPSARTFAALVPAVERVEVEDGLGGYVLSYKAVESNAADAGGARLLGATLRLSKADLRATNQTLLVAGREGTAREYRFIESAYERVPAGRVEPKVFEPEAELAGGRVASVEGAMKDALNEDVTSSSSNDAQSPAPTQSGVAVASAELEVEVTHLLNGVKANLGEQVSVARTTGGQLRVEALVETEGRKTEILRALGPVLNHPAVLLEVATVAERAARTEARGATVESEVEVRAGRMPASEDLRRYLSTRIAGDERIEDEGRRLAGRAMSRSRQALRHASALKRLVERFSPDEVRALDSEARAKWLAMVREHAQAVGREVRALNGELRPVFQPASAQGAGSASAAVDTRGAADRLLRLSYELDESVRSAFTVSTGAGGTARVRSTRFWRALAEAEGLANSIQAAYRQ
ncbi:MAG TPA: hypothetical protein VFX96_07595, partial [Pyrinomonadaceae bacterium]|nr:hypothetical protein [Pyrinomonadaceae bacterium]